MPKLLLPSHRLKQLSRKIIISFTSIFITLSGIELIAYHFFHRTTPSRKGPETYLLRALYQSNRDFIQYNRDCARYDVDLTYTLRPGNCVFSNPEFTTNVAINSLGMRDDEDSLSKPEVVVLGDSHAMGWGVEQEDTFSQIIERRTGIPVLNAAISSYGTAREVELLKRLDLRKVKYFIVQYCPNDWLENQHFCTRSYKLETMPRTTYDWLVHDIGKAKSYWFGQYVSRAFSVHLFRRLAKSLSFAREVPFPTGPSPRANDTDTEVNYFLQILHRGAPQLREVPIIVFEIDGYGIKDSEFISTLERHNKTGTLEIDLRTLDLHGILVPSDFYIVDDHLNKKGHHKVAELVIELLDL